uniref:DUF834 domain-containing protein n=1 Tax=Oryza sativa subsp. indica TaxID=39946 RepID=C5NNW1_ORYSI|nr:hypothetical protein [Oryza sativa Indica Group]
MGAAVAGEPRHNNANGGHREEERETTVLTNTYATTDSDGRWPATRDDNRGVDGLHFAAANPMEATAKLGDDGRSSRASLEIKTRRRQRRAAEATTATARGGWRHGGDGGAPVHDDGLPPIVFGAKQPAARVELDVLEPMEVTALIGNGRGDSEMRLERRRRLEREGERGEKVLGGGRRRGRNRSNGEVGLVGGGGGNRRRHGWLGSGWRMTMEYCSDREVKQTLAGLRGRERMG